MAYVDSADLAGTGTGQGAEMVGFLQSASGAVARTALDKLQETVSVTDFGAIGDGVSRPLSSRFATLAAAQAVYPFVTSLTQTVDWAGVMAALAASQCVHVPKGNYQCGSSEIEITRATRLTGDGPQSSILSWSDSVNGIHLNMSGPVYDSRISGLELVNALASGTPTAGAGILGYLLYFSEIANLRITNFYDGIHFVRCPVSSIRQLNITTFSRYGFWSEGGYGFDCRISDFVISGQVLDNESQPVVHGLVGIRLDDMNDEHVFLNGIVNFCSTGIYTDATVFSVSQSPEFCRFINVSIDSNATGMDLANCADMVFLACFISNRPGHGTLIGERGPTRNVQFFGCTFQSNGGNGAILWSQSKYTNFFGCNFQCNSHVTPGTAHGIVVLDETTNFSVVSSQFDNAWGSGSQNFGLYVVGAACNKFAVIGNDFSASGGSFVNNSTGNDQNIHGNIGYETEFSGSATYDPPSLADGTGVTTTIAVTGAALGDFALAAFSNALQGIILTAWVSAADVVSVRFQNESGGAVDLSSGTLRARVLKP